ncbi:hypothetical protein RCL1_002903 [Eukaryota sp. TZLM3-RCL]
MVLTRNGSQKLQQKKKKQGLGKVHSLTDAEPVSSLANIVDSTPFRVPKRQSTRSFTPVFRSVFSARYKYWISSTNYPSDQIFNTLVAFPHIFIPMEQSIDLRRKLPIENAVNFDCHLKSKVNFTRLDKQFGWPYCLFNLTIEHVPGAGRGTIPANTKICRYFGEIVTSNQEIIKRSQEWETLYPEDVSFILKVGENLGIDATDEIDCIARFVNHSRSPNCYISVINDNEYWVASLRVIKSGEELTFNYFGAEVMYCTRGTRSWINDGINIEAPVLNMN